ncbi:MCE family protein [Nocardia sp.]|uniref:MCE family protein n=1 Tax=Nocardia sp. TaxID=1821 RepID=UPI002587619A|nr:MCE family protein [Nocardia sp.]
MHRRAEYGIAAHWKYKEDRNNGGKERGRNDNGRSKGAGDMAWLRQLIDWQQETKDPGEFLESLRFDLSVQEVFVFTPQGDVISLPQGATEIEQVLGALSLLLNGGGVAQLQPIVTELNKALGGREGRVRSLLEQTETLITGLDQQVDDITRAIDGLGTLSARVSTQTFQIGKILDELPAGIKILNEQRPQLISLLTQLDRVGEAGFDVLNASKDDLIADLISLRPTLQELGRAAPDLVTALPLIPTYPFPDSTLEGTFGGSVNTWLSVDAQIGVALSNLGVGKGDPVYIPPVGRPVPVNPSNPYYNGNGPSPGWPTVSLVPLPQSLAQVPGIPGAPNPLGPLLEQFGVDQQEAPR